MTKPEAESEFRKLVRAYGLKWTAAVPAAAYDKMAEVHKVLTPDECREALRK